MSRGRGNHKKGKRGRIQYNNFNPLNTNGNIIFKDDEDEAHPFGLPPGVNLDVVEHPFYSRVPGVPPLFARRLKQHQEQAFTLPNRRLDPTRRCVIRCFRVYRDMNESTKVSHLFTPDTRISFFSDHGPPYHFQPKQPELNQIFDCTRFIGPGQNCIRFRHESLAEQYFVMEELVKLTIDEVVARVSKQIEPLAECKARIVDSFVKKSDEEVKETARKVSLTDPLSLARMKIPCRGKSCTHVNCFDIRPWLIGVEKHKKFVCPICHREIKVAHLLRDSYFDHILKTVDKHVVEVNFSHDGTWEPIIPPECSVDSAEEAEILGTAAIDKIVDLAFDEIGLGKEDATTRASEAGDDDMDLCIAVTFANDDGASNQRRATVSMNNNNHANRDSNPPNSGCASNSISGSVSRSNGANELRNGGNNASYGDNSRERRREERARKWDLRPENVPSSGQAQSVNSREQPPQASNNNNSSNSLSMHVPPNYASSPRDLEPLPPLVAYAPPWSVGFEPRPLPPPPNYRRTVGTEPAIGMPPNWIENVHRPNYAQMEASPGTTFGGIVQPFPTFSDCDVQAIVDRALNSTRESPKKQQEISRDESSEDSCWSVYESVKASLSEPLNDIKALQSPDQRTTANSHSDFLRVFANSDHRLTPSLDSYFSSQSQLLNSLPLFPPSAGEPNLLAHLESQQTRHGELLETMKQQHNARLLALQATVTPQPSVQPSLLGLSAGVAANAARQPAIDKWTLFRDLCAVAGMDIEHVPEPMAANDANMHLGDWPDLTAALRLVQEADQRREASFQAALREQKLMQDAGNMSQNPRVEHQASELASDGLLSQFRQNVEAMQLRWEEEQRGAMELLRSHQQSCPDLYPQVLSFGDTSIPLTLSAAPHSTPIPMPAEPTLPRDSRTRPSLLVTPPKTDEAEARTLRPAVSPAISASVPSPATGGDVVLKSILRTPSIQPILSLDEEDSNRDAEKLSSARENAQKRFAALHMSEKMKPREPATATAGQFAPPNPDTPVPSTPSTMQPVSPVPPQAGSKSVTNADILKLPSLNRLTPSQQQPGASSGKLAEVPSTPSKRTPKGKDVKLSNNLSPSLAKTTTLATVATEKTKSLPTANRLATATTTKTSALSTVAQTPSTRMKFTASTKEKAVERQRPSPIQPPNSEIPTSKNINNNSNSNNNNSNIALKPALPLSTTTTSALGSMSQASAALEPLPSVTSNVSRKATGATLTAKEPAIPTIATTTLGEKATTVEAPRKFSLSEWRALQSTSGTTHTDSAPTSVYEKLQAKLSSDDEKESAPRDAEVLQKRIEEAKARLRASREGKDSEANKQSPKEVSPNTKPRTNASEKATTLESMAQSNAKRKASLLPEVKPDSSTSADSLQRTKDDQREKDELLKKKEQERAKMVLMKQSLMSSKARAPSEPAQPSHVPTTAPTAPHSTATHVTSPDATPSPVAANVPVSSLTSAEPAQTASAPPSVGMARAPCLHEEAPSPEEEKAAPVVRLDLSSNLLRPTVQSKSPGSGKRAPSPKRVASPAALAPSPKHATSPKDAKHATSSLSSSSDSIAPSSPAKSVKARKTLNSSIEPVPGLLSPRATLTNPKPRRAKRESLSMSDEEVKKAATHEVQLAFIQQQIDLILKQQQEQRQQSNNENGEPKGKVDAMEVEKENENPVARKRGRNGREKKEKAISVDSEDERDESAESCDLLTMDDDEPKRNKKPRKESQARVNSNSHEARQELDDEVILIGRNDKVLNLESKLNIIEEKSEDTIARKLEIPEQGRRLPVLDQLLNLKLKLPRRK